MGSSTVFSQLAFWVVALDQLPSSHLIFVDDDHKNTDFEYTLDEAIICYSQFAHLKCEYRSLRCVCASRWHRIHTFDSLFGLCSSQQHNKLLFQRPNNCVRLDEESFFKLHTLSAVSSDTPRISATVLRAGTPFDCSRTGYTLSLSLALL